MPLNLSNEISLTDIIGISMNDETSNFTDYMATLSALGLHDQFYASNKWALRRAKKTQDINSWLTIRNAISVSMDLKPGHLIQSLTRAKVAI